MNNPISNCCGAPPYGITELAMCSACLKNCEFEELRDDGRRTLRDLLVDLNKMVESDPAILDFPLAYSGDDSSEYFPIIRSPFATRLDEEGEWEDGPCNTICFN